MDYLAERYLRPRKIPSSACSGCGLGQVHKKILLAVEQSGIGTDDLVWGTGIGCSGRQTFNTWKGDNFAGTHGRVYAMAVGLRAALPEEKKILLTVGDGDAFGIGLSHLLHCARRNVGVTVIVADNFGYQSTGGQYGCTTPQGIVTDSSPYGTHEPGWLQDGVDILDILKSAGATFLARHSSFEGQTAVDSVKKALRNKGFSLVHFIYPCVTHFGAVGLNSRDNGEIVRWFEKLFSAKNRNCREPHLTSGVTHDARGARPEFAAALKARNREIREGRHVHRDEDFKRRAKGRHVQT